MLDEVDCALLEWRVLRRGLRPATAMAACTSRVAALSRAGPAAAAAAPRRARRQAPRTRRLRTAQVLPQLKGDAGAEAPPDLPSFLFKVRRAARVRSMARCCSPAARVALSARPQRVARAAGLLLRGRGEQTRPSSSRGARRGAKPPCAT